MVDSASIGIEAGEVLQEVPCLVTAHAGDHFLSDGLPRVEVCQIIDGGLRFVGGEAGCGGFVHVGSMDQIGVKSKGWWTPPQLSQGVGRPEYKELRGR